MSRNDNTSDYSLNFGCDHNDTYCCDICSTDVCNPATPESTEWCYSTGGSNSGPLSPKSMPRNDPRRIRRGNTGGGGQYLMYNGYRTPSIASTQSSGQGPSNPQPIRRQPLKNETMDYPSFSTSGQSYGAIGSGGYSGLAQSPASIGGPHGSDNYASSSYITPQQGEREDDYEEEPESRKKGKGKEKEHRS